MSNQQVEAGIEMMTNKNTDRSKFISNLVKVVSSLILFVSVPAFSARVIVQFKNSQTFNQINSKISLSTQSKLSQMSLSINGQMVRPFANSEANVEDSLQHLKALVLSSEEDSELEKIKSNPLVLSVEKEFFHPAPKPMEGYTLTQPWTYSLNHQVLANDTVVNGLSTGPKTPWGIFAVHAPEAWKLGRAGEGARVAVIDTGIDKDHPALAPNFEKGKDFVHDNNQPYEFADKEGHGSHCPGTIGAVPLADGFVGVAPKVKLLSGRVCSSNGCSNIAVAQAINWAIAEKVDVISMSLGGEMSSPAEQRAVETADKNGIVVVAASGNDGVNHIGFPARFPTVISVGAIDKNLAKAKFSQWGPELSIVAPGVGVVSSVPLGSGRESLVTLSSGGPLKNVLSSAFQGSPEVPHAVSGELVYAGLGKEEDFKDKNLAGKFALIKRGELKFTDKVKNAIAANASGIVLFNNEVGLVQGSASEDGSIVAIPVVMIEQTVGESTLAELNSGAKVVADIQTVRSDYAKFDGTSMATPHVAGVAALVRAENKNLTGAQVKAILKATATALQPNEENQLGSGVVDAEKAVLAAQKQ